MAGAANVMVAELEVRYARGELSLQTLEKAGESATRVVVDHASLEGSGHQAAKVLQIDGETQHSELRATFYGGSKGSRI
jgi:hypothetical protein